MPPPPAPHHAHLHPSTHAHRNLSDVELARLADYVLLIGGDPFPRITTDQGDQTQRKNSLESLLWRTEEMFGQREAFAVVDARPGEEPLVSPRLPRGSVEVRSKPVEGKEERDERVQGWLDGQGVKKDSE
jgi:hypothetical protein